MSFTADQNAALSADLDRKHVSQRAQAGRQLSYIEGWHALSEANRIFGFDGWSSETVAMQLAASGERTASNGGKLFTCTYTARCRVTVYAGDRVITREGVGAGHGMDRDAGQAHEKAVKEAETDSRKRALMTFGNQFGLALYDKTQANVSDGIEDAPEPRQAAPAAPAPTPPAPVKEATSAPSLPQRGGNKEPGGSYHPADAKPLSRQVHNALMQPLQTGYATLAKNRKALANVRRNLTKWEAEKGDSYSKMNEHDLGRVIAERNKLVLLIKEVEGEGDKVPAPSPKTEDIIDPETGELKEAAA
jgi:DNA recombination protein Rad52